jgi:hypothetical protein
VKGWRYSLLSGLNLPFKISAPDLIVLTDDGQGLAIAWCSAFSFFIGTRPSPEDIADSAGGRHVKIDVMIEQPHPPFFWPPVRVFLTQGSQVSGDIIRNRPGVERGARDRSGEMTGQKRSKR